jgi:hypothetical protein
MKKNKSAFLIIASLLYCSAVFPQSSKIVWSGFASTFGNSGNSNSNLISSAGESFNGSTGNGGTTILPGFLTFEVTHLTGIKDGPATVPTVWNLEQNYPNPFNPSTTIKYQVQKTGNVTLKIFDILGRDIITLVNENKREGFYEVRFDASKIPSGVYIYRLSSNEFTSSKKMLLIK